MATFTWNEWQHSLEYAVEGGTYFFTVNLLDRKQTLLIDHIDLLRLSIQKTKARTPFKIDAWVVLPDHMHCIWTLPEGDDAYPGRWREIKKVFSKALPKTEQLSPRRQKKSERGIWQRRYWEHTIRDDLDFQRHMDYLHYNPVKYGHVRSVKDWPYSTFQRYTERGVYSEDWGEGIEIDAGER